MYLIGNRLRKVVYIDDKPRVVKEPMTWLLLHGGAHALANVQKVICSLCSILGEAKPMPGKIWFV